MSYPDPDDYPKTPALEKIQSVQHDSQICGAFLDWLMDRYQLARYVELEELRHHKLVAVAVPIQQVLAEYFEVDLDAAEAEKQKILEYVRSRG